MRPVAPRRVGPQAASPACVRRAGAALCAAALIQYGLIRQRGGRQGVRLSEKHHIVGCFGYAARLRRSMVSSS